MAALSGKHSPVKAPSPSCSIGNCSGRQTGRHRLRTQLSRRSQAWYTVAVRTVSLQDRSSGCVAEPDRCPIYDMDQDLAILLWALQDLLREHRSGTFTLVSGRSLELYKCWSLVSGEPIEAQRVGNPSILMYSSSFGKACALAASERGVHHSTISRRKPLGSPSTSHVTSASS